MNGSRNMLRAVDHYGYEAVRKVQSGVSIGRAWSLVSRSNPTLNPDFEVVAIRYREN